MSLQEVTSFLQIALECSFYLAPREPGLTYDELQEVGKRAGYLEGEIGDALLKVVTQTFGGGAKRLFPNPNVVMMWGVFVIPQDPDYRNITAFDFIYSQMNASIRSMGARSAQLERNVIVERAVAQNIPRIDIEAAITILVACGQLTEKDDQLRSPSGREYQPLPSQQRNQALTGVNTRRSEARERAYLIVKDVVGRRTDGRSKHAEPLDAFAESLDRLGYGMFRLWWIQIVTELRHSNPPSSPVSAAVLSAALVEGALTFVVKHAHNLSLGVLGSKDFDRDSRTWKIDDLVVSAAAGNDTAILDETTKQRAFGLIRTRQRIHAGRMLSEFPAGVPDLRPDEARDAKAIAEQVVRRVLDWLDKYPPSGKSQPAS